MTGLTKGLYPALQICPIHQLAIPGGVCRALVRSKQSKDARPFLTNFGALQEPSCKTEQNRPTKTIRTAHELDRALHVQASSSGFGQPLAG
jgi:hypothetical protein